MDTYGLIWSHIAPYGPTWAHMDPWARAGGRAALQGVGQLPLRGNAFPDICFENLDVPPSHFIEINNHSGEGEGICPTVLGIEDRGMIPRSIQCGGVMGWSGLGGSVDHICRYITRVPESQGNGTQSDQ